MGLAVLTSAQLSETVGMNEAVARKAIRAARKMMGMGFVDIDEVGRRKQSMLEVSGFEDIEVERKRD